MRERKGYQRRAAIPPAVRRALNRGEDEPRTLAEWLAIDVPQLLTVVLPAVGLKAHVHAVVEVAERAADQGTMERHRLIGAKLHALTHRSRRAESIFEALANYPASMAREWAALMVTANPELTLAERLARARRFAADPSMNVREIAWMSYRPYLAGELDAALRLLDGWVRDDDFRVRRCAVESTRPRGVWCAHLPELKQTPARGLPLLEVVRGDAERYVQLSVANWLNDVSKTDPAWVTRVCRRWRRASPTPSTAWTIHHAQRTIRKSQAASA